MMPPVHLPRVSAFPIFAEDNIVTTGFSTVARLPITIPKKFPLKDQTAPDFTLTDQYGRQCSLHDTLKLGRPVILFFFPLAGSPHCTTESCLFRDALEVTPIFDIMQAIVIGISQDVPSRAQRFSQQHKLTYPILYDFKRKIMEKYSVGRTTFGLVDNRATYVIDPSGVVRGLAEGVLNAKGHVKFAEDWLVKLENELAERSRQYSDYVAQEGDMIAQMDGKDSNAKVLQVVYEEIKHRGLQSSLSTPNLKDGQSTRRPDSVRQPKMDKWKSWKLLFSLRHHDAPSSTGFAADSDRSAKDVDVDADADKKSVKSLREPRATSRLGPSRADRRSSRRRLRGTQEGENSLTRGEGLVPPLPTSQAKTANPAPPPSYSPPASTPSSLSNPTRKTKIPVHPLDVTAESLKSAGWEVDTSFDNDVNSSQPRTFSHPRLGSQSSSTVSSRAKSDNPLIASVIADQVHGQGHHPSQPPASAVISEVLMVNSPASTTSRKTSPSASPLMSSLQLTGMDVVRTEDAAACTSLNTTEHSRPSRDVTVPSHVPKDIQMEEAAEESEILSPVSSVLRLFPETPSPKTAKKLERSIAHLSFGLPLDAPALYSSSSPLLDSEDEIRVFGQRRSTDSVATVSGKHTSFDTHHKNGAAAAAAIPDQRLLKQGETSELSEVVDKDEKSIKDVASSPASPKQIATTDLKHKASASDDDSLSSLQNLTKQEKLTMLAILLQLRKLQQETLTTMTVTNDLD